MVEPAKQPSDADIDGVISQAHKMQEAVLAEAAGQPAAAGDAAAEPGAGA